MLKQLYKGTIVTLALAAIAACSTEQFSDGKLAPGDTPIQLTGALTRTSSVALTRAAEGDGSGELITTGNPLFTSYQNKGITFRLSARTADSKNEYFSNISMPVEKNDVSNGTDKLTADAYYPLGEKEIYLYGHTGTVSGNKLPLTSGTGTVNDILLGKGTSTIKKNSDQVSGSSIDPITYMTFRHLMTQVTVKIEVDTDPTTGVEPTIPTDIKIQFSNQSVIQKGTYDILSGTVSPTNTTNYELNVGTHYLVPTGKVLSGTTNPMSSLKIDDYSATPADLAALVLPQAKKNDGSGGTILSDFKLDPGLAYTLTFQIKRLKLVGIALTLSDWDTKSATPTWGYDPYTLGLNITDYSNAPNDLNGNAVNKLVLKYPNGGKTYQYIGEVKGDKFGFVTLPTDLATATGLTVDIYTANGLLANDVKADYSSGLLAIQLDKNGLKKNDTDNFFEVTNPLQFALMMRNPEAKEYHLTNDIDMNHTPIAFEPTLFPAGATLDGKGFSILHLVMSGNGMVPVNNGTLKQVRIASGTITSTSGYAGGLCGTNNSTIVGCINDANIVTGTGQTVGGICGLNNAGTTILACLNTSNILTGQTVGGICGENQNATEGAITACLNVGMLNKSADNLGGICGTYTGANAAIIKTCYWLTGTARAKQAIPDEVAIGDKDVEEISNFTNGEVADLAASIIRTTAIDKLNTALTSNHWKFVLEPSISSWPIPVPNP
jgi:hypothetical protein